MGCGAGIARGCGMRMTAMGLLTAAAAIAGSPVAGQEAPPAQVFVLDPGPDTTRMTGWLELRGEWGLYPNDRFMPHNYSRPGDADKCVSLIDATGLRGGALRRIDGKLVEIEGEALDYDRLDLGTRGIDLVMSTRYYKGVAVSNDCLRQYVFLVKRVRVLGASADAK